MARNKIADLNDHLFAQLERLNDEEIGNEDLEIEIKRAEAISKVASQIISSNQLVLTAAKLIASDQVRMLPEQFGIKALGEG